jgi:glucokinase
MNKDLILGFDIGGTKSSVILATSAGEIIDRASGPTEIADGPIATVNRLISDARRLTDCSSRADRVQGVGICCGGPLDRETGVILGPPNAPGWDYVPIVEMTQKAFELPAFLENDADCCALAELFFGAGKDKKNLIAFTWGTGVGSGIITNGRLYTGTSGFAGEIGHITYITDGRMCQCGKRGCIEAYASGSSIGRIAGESMNANGAPMNTQTVCDAAREGDQIALGVLHDAARAMGRAVSIAAQALNPEIITLGTMAVKASDLLMPEVLRVVEKEVWEHIRRDLTVIPSPLGDRVQDLAAISAFIGRTITESE